MRKVPQFAQMIGRIRHGDEAPARLQDTCELRQPSVQIGNVVEHPRSDDRIELAVCDAVEVEDRDGSQWVELTKRLDTVKGGSS